MEPEKLEDILKEKRRSKIKRRSSFANEAFKLIPSTLNQDEETEYKELVEAIINGHYEWLTGQLNLLKDRMKLSSELASRSIAISNKIEEELSLNTTNIKLSMADPMTSNNEKPRGYEHLTREHRDFLDSHDLNDEYLKKIAKELNNRVIKKMIDQTKENEKLYENKKSTFQFSNKNGECKRLSRTWRSSITCPAYLSNSSKANEQLNPIKIILDYFHDVEE